MSDPAITTYRGTVELVRFGPGDRRVFVGLRKGDVEPVELDWVEVEILPPEYGDKPVTWDGENVPAQFALIDRLFHAAGVRVDATLYDSMNDYRAAWGEFKTTPYPIPEKLP